MNFYAILHTCYANSHEIRYFNKNLAIAATKYSHLCQIKENEIELPNFRNVKVASDIFAHIFVGSRYTNISKVG